MRERRKNQCPRWVRQTEPKLMMGKTKIDEPMLGMSKIEKKRETKVRIDKIKTQEPVLGMGKPGQEEPLQGREREKRRTSVDEG